MRNNDAQQACTREASTKNRLLLAASALVSLRGSALSGADYAEVSLALASGNLDVVSALLHRNSERLAFGNPLPCRLILDGITAFTEAVQSDWILMTPARRHAWFEISEDFAGTALDFLTGGLRPRMPTAS